MAPKNIHAKNNEKHAFLIIAHNDDLAFRTLLSMLDDPRNDIYIHMDAKNKKYDKETVQSLTKHSNIFHVPRINVAWGGYSQIAAILLLLKSASDKHYTYYHLLSGQDLPIKTQDYIHNFFHANAGKEFVKFQSPAFTYHDRVRYYYLLQEKIGRKGNLPLRIMNKILLKTQKILHVNRNHTKHFQKGTNWFSITDNLAQYIVSRESWIKKTFKYTKCCDEIYLQTLIDNSEFKEKLYHKEYNNDFHSIMRLIDWNRGKPYTFRSSDIKEITNSEFLFARKFNPTIDSHIILEIKKLFS